MSFIWLGVSPLLYNKPASSEETESHTYRVKFLSYLIAPGPELPLVTSKLQRSHFWHEEAAKDRDLN